LNNSRLNAQNSDLNCFIAKYDNFNLQKNTIWLFLSHIFYINMIMSVATRIKTLCEIEGSQSNFAEKTGIQRQTVSRIVNRGTGIRSDTIEAIAIRWYAIRRCAPHGVPSGKRPAPPMMSTWLRFARHRRTSLRKRHVRVSDPEKFFGCAEFLRISNPNTAQGACPLAAMKKKI
jgi:uncharacterized protein YerC